jgi:hypothetical protein
LVINRKAGLFELITLPDRATLIVKKRLHRAPPRGMDMTKPTNSDVWPLLSGATHVTKKPKRANFSAAQRTDFFRR